MSFSSTTPSLRFMLPMGLCLLSGAHAFAAGMSDEEFLRRLSEQWESQRTAVQSAVIEYRYVYRFAKPNRSYEDVVSMVKKAASVDTTDSWKNLTTSLDASLKGEHDVWGTSTFYLDGRDSRVDSACGVHTSSHVVAGDTDIYAGLATTDGNYQIDIDQRGQSHWRMASFAEFNRTPTPLFMKLAKVVSHQKDHEVQQVKLKSSLGESTVVEDSGFILQYRKQLPGRPHFEETWQFGSTNYYLDVALPNAIFWGKFDRDKLIKFSLHLIDNAKINEGVQSGTFVVSAIQDDVLVDHRVHPLAVKRVQQYQDNVLDIAPRIAPAPDDPGELSVPGR